ncbi:cysteine--tRNA ligase [Candidatus Woesearchaeota archaeon]|nr:cysteine--tRNA ligase [Candidatus Woesearchaeota archaeon]
MLKLFNTLSRKKETFKPITPGFVTLYTCGPTVYNYAHIGNLRTYLFEDILKRVLLYNSLRVQHVMNITDVGHLTSDADTGEEKMELASRREGKTAWQIADFYAQEFKKDIERLHILPPNVWCKATDHIKEQVALVKQLEAKGYSYVIPADGVYFDTSKFKDYGTMAKLDIEGLKAGARVELSAGKRNPTDFALWKFSPKDQKRQMEWPSPWGTGFPGWHIECSAMSRAHLGDHFDIHCGGIDHIQVHHTNEIAQTEAVTGKKWVNWWMHGEFLILDKGKMSKSAGEFLTLQSVIDRGYDPVVYRYFTLNAQYRSKLNFSWEALDGAKHAWHNLQEKIKEFRSHHTTKESSSSQKHKDAFLDAINDDLNMPVALSVLWAVVKDETLGTHERLHLLEDFDRVFGLGIAEVAAAQAVPLEPHLKALVDERAKARKSRDFTRSDVLRKQLLEHGIIVEDSPDGQVWKRV